MLEVIGDDWQNVLAVRISGRHLKDEAHELALALDAKIAAFGHARCFVEIEDVGRIELGALREGLAFDLKHGEQIDRCAVVGDKHWERWGVYILKLFFRGADVRFFDLGDRESALEWVREDA